MTTRRERLERKAEKRREWAEARQADAAKRFQTAHNATAGIPMGQPILVGHHSESRHRAALARSDSNMRAGCESSDMAEHHISKAAGIERQLRNTIFSDDDNAIEELEAKIAKLEADRERNNAINKIVRAKPKNEPTDEKITKLVALGMHESSARKVFQPDFAGRVGIPSYVNQNMGGVIANAKKRIEDIKRRQERSQAAESNGGISIEGTGDYVSVTFAEKPDRDILTALKDAGFRWGGGSWTGKRADLPECVQPDGDNAGCDKCGMFDHAEDSNLCEGCDGEERQELHDRLTIALPVVADSWEQLRGCDVERLLDSISYDDQDEVADAAEIIKAKRPDLTAEVDEAALSVADGYRV